MVNMNVTIGWVVINSALGVSPLFTSPLIVHRSIFSRSLSPVFLASRIKVTQSVFEKIIQPVVLTDGQDHSGMFFKDPLSLTSETTFTDCEFITTGDGNYVVKTTSNVTFIRCGFYKTSGIVIDTSDNLIVKQCLFELNKCNGNPIICGVVKSIEDSFICVDSETTPRALINGLTKVTVKTFNCTALNNPEYRKPSRIFNSGGQFTLSSSNIKNITCCDGVICSFGSVMTIENTVFDTVTSKGTFISGDFSVFYDQVTIRSSIFRNVVFSPSFVDENTLISDLSVSQSLFSFEKPSEWADVDETQFNIQDIPETTIPHIFIKRIEVIGGKTLLGSIKQAQDYLKVYYF